MRWGGVDRHHEDEDPVAEILRVAVIEDHPIFREGISRGVRTSTDTELAGAFIAVEEFERSGTSADVVVLDLHLPGVSGAEAVQRVRQHAHILIVSAGSSRSDVIDAIGAGAAGYLTKDADIDEIMNAVRHIATGGTYVSPTLAGYLLEPSKAPALRLSNREREILSLVAAGERDQDIADELFLSVRTVRSHLDRIRDKTGQRRRPDLTRYAIEHGITPADAD